MRTILLCLCLLFSTIQTQANSLNIESTPQNYYSTIELLFDSARTNLNALSFAPFTDSSDKQQAFSFLQDKTKDLYLYDDRGEYQPFFSSTQYQLNIAICLFFIV